MSVRRGISLLDLLPQTTGLAVQVPDGIVEQIGALTILDHRSTASGDFYLHEGTLQAPLDALDVNTANWPIKIPGLTQGLPFRFAVQRPAPVAGQQEPAPQLWTLDIEVWDVEVQIPGVRAARQSGGTGVTPLTLTETGTTDATRRVFLAGQGVIRISGGGTGGTQVQIVDSPDPLDPLAPTGAVIRLTAKPSSFLFGQSKYGMTLDQFVLDLSKTFTPADIVARGHDETWEGVSFKETTFYFPPDTPLVHSLSISARDVIVGDPGGLQGELRVEFGQDFTDVYNTRIAIKRLQDDGTTVAVAETTPPPRETALQFAVAVGPNDTPKRIRAEFQVGAGELIPGHTDLAVVGVWWRLPDGTEGNDPVTPWFDAPTTQTMRYRLREGAPTSASNTASPPSSVPTDQTEMGEVTVSFPRDGAGPSGIAPIVDATVSATTYNNVTHLRGPRTLLQGIQLAVRGGGNATWTLGTGSAPTIARDVATFTLPLLADGAIAQDLTVVDTNGTRRIRIEPARQGKLAVGHQASAAASSAAVVTVDGLGDATPTTVTETFLATPYHLQGDHRGAPNPATLSGTQITVPQGADAEVEVPVPSGDADPLPPPSSQANQISSIVQVLYDWDKSAPTQVVSQYDGADDDAAGDHAPIARPMALHLDSRRGFNGNSAAAQLADWIAQLPTPNGRKYFIVGRTDDLKQNGTLAENNTYNRTLGTSRAEAAHQLLMQVAPGADVTVRYEVDAFPSDAPGIPAGSGHRINNAGRLVAPTSAGPSPVWHQGWNPDSNTDGPTHQRAKDDPRRPPYRTAEIYAVDTGSPPPPPPPTGGGVPVRMLVPGPDGTPDPPVASTTTAPPPTDYRVRLRVKWDSPTVVSAADVIPTEAEALVAWKKAQVELPATQTGPGHTLPPPTGPDYWQVLLQWAYDARTGETQATGALSLPDGTLNWQNNALAGALAFGPAITALLNPADTIKDPLGEFVAAAAIIAAGAAIGELINSSGPESSVDIEKFAISYKWNGAPHVSATIDYTVDLRVNVSVSGAGSLTGHLKLRYKGVGLRFDGAPGGGLAGVALTYDSLSVEVVDPGTWSLGGPLGNLIRIAASRMGNGSQWMEFDLAFALDLGVITLEGATIRLGLSPFSVELRGLTASVDIPATLKGKGSVTIGDGGAFRALLALEVIPAKLSAYGSLAVDQDFVAVEVGIQLPVGIPLGGTGFGIFGFMGRFVANGTRNLVGLSNPDPVQKQLDWYTRPPQDKYARKSGQFAFGVGAVIGTLPDSAFTFNAEGGLTIGFPDVSVVFSIDAHLMTQRKFAATETGTPNAETFRILGMVLIDETSIMVAVRATFEIPKVLRLEIPISAYFPLAGTDAWYIRIGTDNEPDSLPDHHGRPGSPVTIVLLPGTLDVKAWAFVLIEEKQLHHLGGSLVPLDLAQPLDFDGFSIGMGAGFDLKWSAGPFSLEISAFLLVGMGTKPLLFAGAAGIKGSLDLVILSVGVDGLIHFHIQEGYNYLDGHFCGHVDLLFFTVSGCVDIHIGDDPPSTLPEPESPFAGMDLCDHLAVVKGRSARTNADPVPVVWPDTIAVLRCTHYVEDGAGPDFNRLIPPPAALTPWTGSTELKYAYRLKTLELWQLTGGNPDDPGSWTKVSGPFDSAWWLPTHRTGIIQGGDNAGPSTEEGRELGLFAWDPAPWSRWLGDGSQNLPGDPANTVGQVCDPAKPADPSCAHGKDWAYSNGHLGSFKAVPPPGTAFPSRFTVLADFPAGLDSATLAALGADAGWTWGPGVVTPLHGSVTLHGTVETAGWHFPGWTSKGLPAASAPIVLTPSKTLLQGELVLEVCASRQTAPLPQPSQCDPMPKGTGPIESFVGDVSKSKYAVRAGARVMVGTEPALTITAEVQGTNPGTVDGVSVDIDVSIGSVTVTALDSANNQIGTATTQGTGRQWVRIDGKGINHVRILPNPTARSKANLFEVCWGATAFPAILSAVSVQPSPLPVVTAFDVHGKPLVLTGVPLPMPAPPATVVIQRCPKLLYTLPKGDGWTRITVAPWPQAGISLVALCGVTLEASAAQGADQGMRDALKNLYLGLIQDVVSNQPTHKVYLDAATTYEIRAAWQWQGFRPAHQGDDPPATSAGTWKDAANAERFRFTTADYGVVAAPAPAQTNSLDTDPAQGGPGFDERTFDPRGLARFLTAATPTHEDPPQFLDDPVGFWFSADHLEPLTEKYDRILQVKVLHTRPAAGSLHPPAVLVDATNTPLHIAGTKHALDVTTSADWKVTSDAWFEADYRVVVAAEAAPCLGGAPATGASSVSVTANLEPRSEYDLLLNVAPKVVNTHPEVPVARSHFRTSRYRNPTEMLAGLGFAAPVSIFPPTEAIATAPLAAAPLEIGDTALDAALTAMGLDPWPLPAAPRTTVIWLRPAAAGQPWRVAAVIVEADEPIWRAGFMTGAIGEPIPPPRLEVQTLRLHRTYETTTINPLPPHRPIRITHNDSLGDLTERVRGAAGTRAIFVPAASIAMTGGRIYDLELTFRERGATGAAGKAPLLDRPMLISQEGE